MAHRDKKPEAILVLELGGMKDEDRGELAEALSDAAARVRKALKGSDDDKLVDALRDFISLSEKYGDDEEGSSHKEGSSHR